MDWWVYVVIITVILSGLGFALYFFQIKKEEQQDEIVNSKARLENMVADMDILVELAKDNIKLKESLEEVQDKIRYSPPATSPKTIQQDERIRERLGDLKILVARAKAKGSYSGCIRAMNEIELLLVERNAKIK